MISRIRPFLYYYIVVLLLSACFLAGLHLPAGGGSPWWHAFFYQACHCNVWHLMANLWCLWLIASSNYRVSARQCILAYSVSVLASFASCETEGLSGLLYALIGMLSWQAARIRTFHLWMLGFVSVGLLVPHRINVILHLVCYAAGIVCEMPFCPWRERLRTYWS